MGAVKQKKKKKWWIVVLVILVLGIIGSFGSDDEEGEDTRQIPTQAATEVPTEAPTEAPTATEAPEPTEAVLEPTVEPEPTATPKPTSTPTPKPTATPAPTATPKPTAIPKKLSVSDIPEYSLEAYISVFDNIPQFTDGEITTQSFEEYSPLDALGRCGVAYACIGTDLLPEGERGEIGQIKPAGWHTVKYEGIDGLYLYNRCHLIGWQLTGENANEKNLITGTRYMNIQGMQPFENKVYDYVRSTGNHVLYRVTPMYKGNNLIAEGLQIEALSVEDNGKGICFNVFCYNVQPGIVIDYATGDSYEEEVEVPDRSVITENEGTAYVLNTNTKKFHYPYCSSVADIKAKNYAEFVGDRQELIGGGYSACKRCNP